MNFELADLRAFVAVAELGSFHGAADVLHLSPPAVSRRVQKLEEVLGVRLFERTTRLVRLTLKGREFARRARGLLDDVEAALVGIQDARETREGTLAISCVHSAMRPFVIAMLKSFHVRWPNIRIRIEDTSAIDVLSSVIQDQAEFGLDFIGMGEPEIDFEPLVREPYMLVCRHDDPLAGQAQVRWAEVTGRELIGSWKGSGNRIVLDAALATLRQRPRWCYELARGSSIPRLIEAGLGVAAIPRLAFATADHPTLTCVRLIDPVVVRTLGLIRKRGRTLSLPARELYELIANASAQVQLSGEAVEHCVAGRFRGGASLLCDEPHREYAETGTSTPLVVRDA
jgi:DNA-binding transcriptional LysR family regulator